MCSTDMIWRKHQMHKWSRILLSAASQNYRYDLSTGLVFTLVWIARWKKCLNHLQSLKKSIFLRLWFIFLNISLNLDGICCQYKNVLNNNNYNFKKYQNNKESTQCSINDIIFTKITSILLVKSIINRVSCFNRQTAPSKRH